MNDKSARIGDIAVAEGDVLSLDGATGDVVLGAVDLVDAQAPEELEKLLGWADEIRTPHLGVRANADNGPDARNARQLGAEGIGLCRTEHMFFGDDRLPIMRRMILAGTEEQETAALDELGAAQFEDFVAILEAMDGLPVTVRLLDPPLHEFLPDVESLEVKRAEEGLSAEEDTLLAAAKEWSEENPMIGTRGVRLGVIRPGLYAMQVKALMRAVAQRLGAGGDPYVEIMIPLVVTEAELALARSWVVDAMNEFAASEGSGAAGSAHEHVAIGTMIETPRAALRAADIARQADFFSFGTNDLTQLTFGFSRDDIESRIMPVYLAQHLLDSNPFETIDADGVGELVTLGIERGRSTKPELKIGVCGEHGGDPTSIELFARAGMNYVSCSPFRVPIARIAAAKAVLAIAEKGSGRSDSR